jgi:ABC-type phosphonate transport system ATPase subunit
MTLLEAEKKGIQKYYENRESKPKVSFALYKDSNRGIVGFAALILLLKTISPWLVPTTGCFLSGTQKKN